SGKICEHLLHNVGSQFIVAGHLPQSRGIDKIQMALHEFAKCLFALRIRVLAQQLFTRDHLLSIKTRLAQKTDIFVYAELPNRQRHRMNRRSFLGLMGSATLVVNVSAATKKPAAKQFRESQFAEATVEELQRAMSRG